VRWGEGDEEGEGEGRMGSDGGGWGRNAVDDGVLGGCNRVVWAR
jgi:hypothetical protein